MKRLTSKLLITVLGLGLGTACLQADEVSQTRTRSSLDDNWKFAVGDAAKAETTEYDDATCRTVTLPHDWSIEGKCDVTAAMGGAGGFLPSGIGW